MNHDDEGRGESDNASSRTHRISTCLVARQSGSIPKCSRACDDAQHGHTRTTSDLRQGRYRISDMARTKLVSTTITCSCWVVMLGAQRLDSAREAINTYLMAVQAAQKAPSSGQLEVAFNAISPLRDVLVLDRDGNGRLLESLPERQFTELRRELVGLLVNREEVVFVEPDVLFFRRLARRGDRADRAFFAALSSTYPESVWPVYVEQQTDYSGCTRFGSGTLVSTYLTWAAFRRQHPNRYETGSRSHLDEIVRTFTESTCACGDRASVEQELTEFLRRADASDVRSRVAARLAAIRGDRANVRFRCTSG